MPTPAPEPETPSAPLAQSPLLARLDGRERERPMFLLARAITPPAGRGT